MALSHRGKCTILATFILLLTLLAACGGAPTTKSVPKPTPKPSPTPTPSSGQQLLTSMATALNTAKTLHGIFNLTIHGQATDGTINSEIWDVPPAKSRTEVHQSTLSQVTPGSIMVTDGHTLWQYDPTQNVVYTGPVPPDTNGTQNSIFGSSGSGQSKFLLTIVNTIFTHSDGTLRSSASPINGHDVYDVHVVPSGTSNGTDNGSFSYDGEVYIDKTTHLPLKVTMNIQSLGTIDLDLPTLELNQPIPDSTFTFTPPAGAKVLPLQQATPTADTGSLTLVQAQQQADFHLLSIPADQSDYVLEGVTALGSPGNELFALNYMKGNQSVTITQGKQLANLPPGSGQHVHVRNADGIVSTTNGTTTLSWTEKGVGIQISAPFTANQLVTIANTLS